MQLISDKIFNLSVNPFLGKIKSRNNSAVHWKSEWFKTEKPSFFVFSNTKITLVDWDIKTYRGSLNFNETENQSLYIGVGNGSAFLGYDLKKKSLDYLLILIYLMLVMTEDILILLFHL